MKTNLITRIICPMFFAVCCCSSLSAQFFTTGGYQDGAYASGGDEVYVNINTLGPDTRFESYPVPFHDKNQVHFTLYGPSRVTLSVVDPMGRTILTLIDSENLSEGKHEIQWERLTSDGQLVPAGIYFYKFIVNEKIMHKKIICL